MQREEDSGLHDIRNLAQSTKQRLSKRTTGSQALIKSDDDVLASSSASWKNLALPQPAKMVSLPELDELPSKQEIAKAAKAAAKEAARAAKQEAKHEAKPVTPAEVYDSASGNIATNTSGAVEFKPAFSSFAAPKPKAKSHTGRNLALVGMGLAAAAGITLFVVTQNNDQAQPRAAQAVAPATATANGVSADKMKQLDEATAKLNAQHEAQVVAEATPPPVDQGSAATGAAGDQPAVEAPAAAKAQVATKGPAKKPTVTHGKGKVEATVAAAPEQKADTAKGGKPAGGEAPEKEKDFDALLKEAGVQDKKTAKPKLDKKELSGEDFKKGMAAITAKAQGCYKGTQGSANVKLTIAPSGQVSKVSISGAFAGKPEADCVASAVKSASFPAWDGPPQSFGYPILLSE